MLSHRLRRRLRATDIGCFDEYLALLQQLRRDAPEWDAFVQEITTHETYLFRDAAQWDWFGRVFLNELQAAARRGARPKTLRVWSAACSTGEEVYTIACCVADSLLDHNNWKIEILGTDIGVGALAQARANSFDQRSMRNVPPSHMRRFFLSAGADHWTVKPGLARWTRFRQHNLLEPIDSTPFDLVFLKNVLIYFDLQSKRRVFAHIDAAIRPGGLLVTGPADGVSQLTHLYERRQPWLHRKTSPTPERLVKQR